MWWPPSARLPASPALEVLNGSEIFICVPQRPRSGPFDRNEAYESQWFSVTAATVRDYVGGSPGPPGPPGEPGPPGPPGATGATGPPGLTRIALRVFSASGTYTPSLGLVSAIVECIGGGGGGGNVVNNGTNVIGGGGGGSGGYSRKGLTAAQIGASQPVIIGAGGAPGAGGNPTSFGALCQANGGGGGGVGDLTGGVWSSPGQAGAAATTGIGDITLPGDGGTQGLGESNPTSGLPGAGAFSIGGLGGSPWGGRNQSSWAPNGTSDFGGHGAANTGAGGNGAVTTNSSALPAPTGGVGGSGICVITEYIA